MSEGGSGSPYRAGHGAAREERPEESDGLVGELIRQFADPLAFYRELVQNAIDAGSSRIVVQLAWEGREGAGGGEGELRISVRDDGEGMDQDILENQLTVLFRSGKEERRDAIGKFGVGFVSVLGVSPSSVVVRTSRGEGELFTLHLFPDRTYELFRAAGGKESGTTVTLHVPMPRIQVASYVKGSEEALTKWCRHAQIPILFSASAPAMAAPEAPQGEAPQGEAPKDEGAADEGDARAAIEIASRRIDRPLDVEALVKVRFEGEDEEMVLVVGVPHEEESYAGFFNHGLLLHETRQPLFGPLVFKAQDARLEHTLSRDNVRRDPAFERVVARLEEVARGPLAEAFLAAMDEAAARAARGEPGEPSLHALLCAYDRSSLGIELEALPLPLFEEDGGRRVERARALRGGPVFYARAFDPLVGEAVRAGHAVLDARAFGGPLAWLRRWLIARFGDRARETHRALTRVAPAEASPSDGALLDHTVALLEEVHRRPGGLRLGRFLGALKDRLWLPETGGEGPWLLSLGEERVDPLRLLLRPAVILNAEHELVAAARRRALSEPSFAAGLLARGLLLSFGASTEARGLAILRRMSEDLVKEGS